MDKFVPGKWISETLRDSMKVPNKKAKMVAHRGLSGLELENTNAAFVAAGQRSFYGIETDTQRTKDGHFIAFHDGELDRMMGVSIKICDITLEELRKYRMKDFWEKRTRSDLIVPTLDEYIRICKHYRKVCILEIKDYFSDKDIEDMLALIKEEDYLDNVVFISGNWDSLINLRKQLPEHPAQYICGKVDDELIEKLVENKLGIDPYFECLSEEIVKKLHDKGIEINCWTVNEVENVALLDKWGVDMITSNFIE
ncbi:MAG: hypothetical protein IJE40_02805 [Clostridia bacterium]|nr:hypothetical protein [Clostridia bacterium]